MGDNLLYSVRGSTGFSLNRGLNAQPERVFEDKQSPKENPCRTIAFSHNGQYFAFCDSVRTVAMECSTGRKLLTADLKRTQQVIFSPRDTHMLTFEPYTLYGPKIVDGVEKKPEPNLRIWSMPDGKHITTLIAQKQSSWAPQWTEDESIALRLVGSELLLHKQNLFEKYDAKLTVAKIDSFAVSPGSGMGGQHHVATYVPAAGGQPGKISVHRLNSDFSLVSNKTLMKTDRANMHWNCKGNALLIVTSTDVDATNQSYYGEQSIYLINVATSESCIVPLHKKGPIYAAKWNPNGREFAVCYGYMPAKVTLYNLRGDAVFDMAEGPKNDIHYNTFGNILLVCGFGNIATGKMEFWDVEKRKGIVTIEVPNTTQFEWAPDGQHFMTATTTPRLRIDNNYRLWHYTGRMLAEVPYASPQEELWQVQWRPLRSYNRFEVQELTKQQKMQAGLLIKKAGGHPLNNLPSGAVSKAGAYVPPHLRKTGQARGAPASSAAAPQKTELEKAIVKLQKKIDDIASLKDKQAKGEKMQANQLTKIAGEAALLEELNALKV